MSVNKLDDFARCVLDGFTKHVQNWSSSRTNGKFTIKTAYQDWNVGDYLSEPNHCAAIIKGLTSYSGTNIDIDEIWCAREHNHSFINGIKTNTSYASNLRKEWFPKDPDIAFSTSKNGKPNWFCQVKLDVHNHVKSVQALGDFFWGAITKLIFEKEKRRKLEYFFVWAEYSTERHSSGGFLKFQKDQGVMELKLSPGFTSKGLGKCDYDRYNVQHPWWDASKAVLVPNNYTTIKQLLAAGTNGTFYRMFHQKGELSVKSEYRQLFIPTKNGEGWNVYVHRLLDSKEYKLTNAGIPKGGEIQHILDWIP